MIHVEETQGGTDSIHEEDEQYHNKQGYEKPNRKKKKPILSLRLSSLIT